MDEKESRKFLMNYVTHSAKQEYRYHKKDYDKKFVCDFCGRMFDLEIELLAHQFNSPCEPKEIDY